MTILFHMNTVDGFESLSISEKIKIFFSDISLGIDKINASVLNSSIHTVNTQGVFDVLKRQNNYFDFASNQIPIPVFFNPKTGNFKDYVSFCVDGVALLAVAKNEVDRLYVGFKRVANNGAVPYTLRDWHYEKEVTAIKDKSQTWFNQGSGTTLAINQVYKSLSEAEDIYAFYNNTVKSFKSRDVEILTKSIEQLTDLFKLIKQKIEKNDIVFNADDRLTVELIIGRLNELVYTTGMVIGRLNELARVMELQVDEFKRYKK